MASGNQETEIKLRLRDIAAVRDRLTNLQFRVRSPRTFEANILLDTPSAGLRAKGEVLRVREYGPVHTLTFKGRGDRAGKHKVREEIETVVADASALLRIFERLGYHSAFRYEKYRTEYTDSVGIVTIDETPIGNFLELEGEPEWIDKMAAALGYTEGEYITLSYGGLYQEHCRYHQTLPMDMIFASTTGNT